MPSRLMTADRIGAGFRRKGWWGGGGRVATSVGASGAFELALGV